ncbi:ribonuclease HII [Hyphobacterium sp. CCMP332]|uniref:ribonuclease HII n=1 Tax=Hyphobacterium sp. CCMP332 TaxID=2749086 RepID=UPI00164FFA41|nr:ribonuclease HII [Hyphobacterium sp. CCMP332]QNL19244.1 ribonuclease HII [Hyphobacterium sp. CCMP332]
MYDYNLNGPICGIDEAGRGPLAGPVVAAAVILREPVDGLNDSKKLSEKRRIALAREIRETALFGVGIAEPEEIDRINILQATMVAMRRAAVNLGEVPAEFLIDGNRTPDQMPAAARFIIGGDALEPSISAASIIAKTVRDELMIRAAQRWPAYGFEGHKGYGARTHLDAIAAHGPCPIHRMSFSPMRQPAFV